MTTAYWCILIAMFLPIVFTGIAKASGKGYNNAAPREFQNKLSGFRQRAHWAHLNQFESFPPFAAATIIAHLLAQPQDKIDQLAIAYIVFRLLYAAMYLANQASLRSLMWLLAFACPVAMFFV